MEAHLHLSYNNVKVIGDLDLNCPPECTTLLSAPNAQDRRRLCVMKGGRIVTRNL